MLQIIAEIMETEVLEELTFCIVDIVSMLEVRGMQAEHAHIRRILQQNWELRPSDKPKYYIGRRLTYDSRIEQTSSTGRCYIITRQKLNEILLVC